MSTRPRFVWNLLPVSGCHTALVDCTHGDLCCRVWVVAAMTAMEQVS